MTGGTYSIIPDQIEAGTYMTAVAAAGGEVLIKNVIPKHLDCITAKLMEMGVTIEDRDDAVLVRRTGQLTRANIKTMPYPGFPTDMQPQMTAVLCMAEGTSVITEGVWDNRYKYVDELKRMGAKIQVDGKIAVVEGVGKLTGAPVQACDLRAGAAMVIVCDPIEKRRKAALENGADVALDPSACDAGLEIRKLTGKRGADVILETSGSYSALQAAIRGCAYAGSIAVVGWYKECHGALDLGREAHFNQPNILISRACSEPNRDYPRWDFARMCKVCWDMLQSGQLKCENIVDPVVPFDQAAEMYMHIEQNPNESVKMGVDF
jgi:hypothetical protein